MAFPSPTAKRNNYNPLVRDSQSSYTRRPVACPTVPTSASLEQNDEDDATGRRMHDNVYATSRRVPTSASEPLNFKEEDDATGRRMYQVHATSRRVPLTLSDVHATSRRVPR